MLFTSGTTGNPKGVMTAHGQNLRVFADLERRSGLREGDRYLIVNPFFHSFGYKAGWLSCLMRGATALPHAVFDVPAAARAHRRERISVLPGPPALYQSILAHPERARYDLSSCGSR
jgi:HIP---CoA ligase